MGIRVMGTKAPEAQVPGVPDHRWVTCPSCDGNWPMTGDGGGWDGGNNYHDPGCPYCDGMCVVPVPAWYYCDGCRSLFTCEPAQHGPPYCFTPRLFPTTLSRGLRPRGSRARVEA